MLSETKLEVSFPTKQFRMKDFTAPYRLVRNGSVGGILVYVRKDTPSKLLALYFLNVECFSVEINLRK